MSSDSSGISDENKINFKSGKSDTQRRHSDGSALMMKPPPPSSTQDASTLGQGALSVHRERRQSLNLGPAVSSYYFQGTPKTPVQKLVNEKLLLAAVANHQSSAGKGCPIENSLNSSYLSSSSSDNSSATTTSTNSGGDYLNTSVLSDTTELTASNFVHLASTQRLSQQQLQTMQAGSNKPPLRALHGNQRRQTIMAIGANKDRAIEESDIREQRRRRETVAPMMSVVSHSNQSASPSASKLVSVVERIKEQRLQRQSRMSLDNDANNNTSETHLSVPQMQALLHLQDNSMQHGLDEHTTHNLQIILNMSVENHDESGETASIHDFLESIVMSSSSQGPINHTQTDIEEKDDQDESNVTSNQKCEADTCSHIEASTGTEENSENDAATKDSQFDMLASSPNTLRGSFDADNSMDTDFMEVENKKVIEEKQQDMQSSPSKAQANDFVRRSTNSSDKDSSDKDTLNMQLDSTPARNTRSRSLNSENAYQKSPAKEIQQTFPCNSPARLGTNSSSNYKKKKSPARRSTVSEETIDQDSPARNTRSAKKQKETTPTKTLEFSSPISKSTPKVQSSTVGKNRSASNKKQKSPARAGKPVHEPEKQCLPAGTPHSKTLSSTKGTIDPTESSEKTAMNSDTMLTEKSYHSLEQTPSAKHRPVDSPARNTRSRSMVALSADERITSETIRNQQHNAYNEELLLFDNTTANIETFGTDILHVSKASNATLREVDSPARNTRSATKKSRQSTGSSTGSLGCLFEEIAAAEYNADKSREKLAALKTNEPGSIRDTDESMISISSIMHPGKKEEVHSRESTLSADNETMGSIQNLLEDIVQLSQSQTDRTNEPLITQAFPALDSIGSKSTIEPDEENDHNESTGSLGGVFNGIDGYMDNTNSNASFEHYSSGSMKTRTSVSLASVITTPAGMSHHEETSNLRTNNTSPPSTIHFPTSQQQNSVDYIQGQPIAKPSPLKRALTPTKVTASPRRLLLSKPYTRSPFKKALTPTKLKASPMRHVPSSSKRKQESFHSYEPTSAIKRQKTFEQLQNFLVGSKISDDGKFSDVTAEIGVEHRTETLNSVLKRPGETSRKKAKSGRRVAFGSPKFAEFNSNSPSMRLTPMPKDHIPRNLTASSPISSFPPDDTAEIEANMYAFFAEGQNKVRAGSTPYNLRKNQKNDESKVSIATMNEMMDNKCEAAAATETPLNSSAKGNHLQPRETLERVLMEDDSDMSLDSATTEKIAIDSTENTVPLELNLSEVLQEGCETYLGYSGMKNTVAEKLNDNEFEDATMELESNINMLLCGDDEVDSRNETPASSSISYHRRSISSRRFSINPVGKLSLSFDGSFVEQTEDRTLIFGDKTLDEAVESNISATTPTDDKICIDETLNLTKGEILQHCNTSGFIGTNSNADFLLSVVDELRDFQVADATNMLLSSVIEIVTAQTESEIVFDEPIDILIDHNLGFALQRAVRSDDKELMQHKLQCLTKVHHDKDAYEWTSWLVSAAEALESPLEEKCNNLATELSRLDDVFFEIDRSFALMTNAAVNKARRRSMEQRLDLISSVEREIEEMEHKIHRMEGYTAALTKEESLWLETENSLSNFLDLSHSYENAESAANASERNCSTLKGLMKWQPSRMSESELSFNYIGPFPKSCIFLSFTFAPSGTVSCTAEVKPDLFPKHSIGVGPRLLSVSNFFQQRVEEFCETVNKQHIQNTRHVGEILRLFEWQLGRLEQTSSELETLKRRYQAMLQPSKETCSSEFNLEVYFSGSGSVPAKLRATFEISRAYPFAPVSVYLEKLVDGIDDESLRKLLLKNAKPGFGYLSRICDTIAAFSF
jgi:hypothetical protein